MTGFLDTGNNNSVIISYYNLCNIIMNTVNPVDRVLIMLTVSTVEK